MEVTQFSYFLQVGGLDCFPVTGEITYGLERIAMYLLGVESVLDLVWTDGPAGKVTYGDVFHQNEVEMSTYNFDYADTAALFGWFDTCERESNKLIEAGLPLPAYEMVLKASHTFNQLDARRAISVTERQRYILRVRALARAVAAAYYARREALGLPMATPSQGAGRGGAARGGERGRHRGAAAQGAAAPCRGLRRRRARGSCQTRIAPRGAALLCDAAPPRPAGARCLRRTGRPHGRTPRSRTQCGL